MPITTVPYHLYGFYDEQGKFFSTVKSAVNSNMVKNNEHISTVVRTVGCVDDNLMSGGVCVCGWCLYNQNIYK